MRSHGLDVQADDIMDPPGRKISGSPSPTTSYARCVPSALLTTVTGESYGWIVEPGPPYDSSLSKTEQARLPAALDGGVNELNCSIDLGDFLSYPRSILAACEIHV